MHTLNFSRRKTGITFLSSHLFAIISLLGQPGEMWNPTVNFDNYKIVAASLFHVLFQLLQPSIREATTAEEKAMSQSSHGPKPLVKVTAEESKPTVKVMPEIPTNIHDVRLAQSGRISQNNPKIFGDRNNSQCTAIAAYSIPALAANNPPFSRDLVDDIVRNGDAYYARCKEGVTHKFLAADELLPDLEIPGVGNVRITVEPYGEGRLTANVQCGLVDLVSDLRNKTTQFAPKCGFLFIAHSKTVSFVPVSGSKSGFWMFNSHAVNSNNEFQHGPKGVARIFHAYSTVGLVNILLRGHPRDNAYWQVYLLRYE